MLRATGNSLRESGMSEEDIRVQPRLPDMLQMLQQLGYDRAYYVGVQRMPSHSIHGNWSDLVTGYLDLRSDPVRPRATHSAPHPGQYIGIALVVLGALIDYIGFLMEPETARPVLARLADVRAWTNAMYEDLCSYELEPENDAGYRNNALLTDVALATLGTTRQNASR
jgi:hypothetical protein